MDLKINKLPNVYSVVRQFVKSEIKKMQNFQIRNLFTS